MDMYGYGSNGIYGRDMARTGQQYRRARQKRVYMVRSVE